MNKLFTKYFKKHPVYKAVNNTVPGKITVVIPVFLEEDNLQACLGSLKQASSRYIDPVEIILVFNYSENAAEEVKKRQSELLADVSANIDNIQTSLFKVTLIKAFDLKAKFAGVGYARKIGMDFAAKRFAGMGKYKGVLVSLDADCLVEDNYFSAIGNYFKNNTAGGCNIFFSHPLEGKFNDDTYDAVAQYELHLRYYVQALRWTGFPYAFHSVGSCFAVTAEAYVRAGGMPRKQAGEDFYFLQKVIPLGGFGEVKNTTVYPSARPSSRVPFGTGPSVRNITDSKEEYNTYNIEAFAGLKSLFEKRSLLFNITDVEIDDFAGRFTSPMKNYLLYSDFFESLKPVNDNCSSQEVFDKRFFEVFNAFRVVKYLNFTHDGFYTKKPVIEAANCLHTILTGKEVAASNAKSLLMLYREMEKAIF